MAVCEVLKAGNPILRQKSEEVGSITGEISKIFDDLYDTMKYTAGIGIAAPQIGILKRIIVMEYEGQIIKIINPEIVEYKGKQEFLEGCLSVGDDKDVIGGWVERPYEVKVKALDETGKEVEYTANEMLAIMFSHEIDHLNGIIFTDKTKDELLHFSSVEERREYRKSNPRKDISKNLNH